MNKKAATTPGCFFVAPKRKKKAMTKSGKRYCDRCKKPMPKIREEGSNVHDLLSLGWKTKTGTVMGTRKDICSECMDELDEFLSGKQN